MSVTERVIFEQFPFWRSALKLDLPRLPNKTFVFVGCGTSYYLAQTVTAAFNLVGRDAVAVPGSEWIARRQAYVGARTDLCVVGLSRSGDSTETVQALAESGKAGFATVAITCAPGSAITQVTDNVIVAETHAEEGVVMTASASLMLLLGLRLIDVPLSGAHVDEAERLLATMKEKGAQVVAGRRHFVYLGGGPLYGLAAEGALKLMEMSLSFSQSFHPLEYRHGPISLVDDATLVALLYNEATRVEEERVAADVRKKGAFVIGFGGEGDLSLPVAETGLARALVLLPALQLLGEQVAVGKRIDTTAPRHLTKVVTLA